MSAPYGRTYRVQIDVIAEEYVTVLETGDLLLEDAITGEPVFVDRDRLDEFATTNAPYTEHIADCIRRDLFDDRHPGCGWEWTRQESGGWWYRSGRCPYCGQR